MSRDTAIGGLWQGVLPRLRERVSDQQFETWFRSVEQVLSEAAGDDDTLLLSVPNSFAREWIGKKYREAILDEAEKELGRRPKLQILVREEEEPDPAVTMTGGGEIQETRSPATPAAPATHTPDGRRTWLNDGMLFSTFLAGGETRLAHAAALDVAETDHREYNPLFIHGNVGLGKTHLLQAICQAVLARCPEARVRYVSCETFINQFISAVDGGDLDAFRRRYRELDYLVMDDVQFLGGKERSQEEFFHTFNELHTRKKQIVLSADTPPAGIPHLSDRLLSRFRAGMVCEVLLPGYDTCLEIVRQKARQLGGELPDGVASFVAEQVRTNVREIEGAVTRIIGHAHLSGRAPDQILAREVLRDVVVDRRRRVSMEHISEAVTRHYGVKLAELQSRKRTQAVALPRQICMFLARRLTGHSLEEIGGFFGGRDHSTVLYGVDRIGQKISSDQDLKDTVDSLGAQALCLASS